MPMHSDGGAEAFSLEPSADEPQLSIVAFRLNHTWLQAINDRKRVLLTGTMLGDRFALRICALCFRTHQDRLEMCLEDIRAARQAVSNA